VITHLDSTVVVA